MSEHAQGLSVPTVVEIDESLVDAKLSIPQPRAGLVHRAGLIERARATDHRVVGVTAPAGYGKSTLLVEWALTEDRPVAWVALDRFDDDPAVLLTLLASAYARISPDDSDLVDDMSGVGLSVLGRAAPRLASALRRSQVPFVLMLDDLHELQSPDCHDVLGVVISGIPPGSQFVAASRFEQPHLPRLRVSGDVLELRMADLALDAVGAAQIFADAQVSLTPELAATVTERTEGWPVGIRLAAMIAHDGADGADGVLAVAGDDRYVADYLYRESLVQLPERLQRFLRYTAVLDQMCAPLCEALLGESGAQELLRQLEAANLFLVALDRRREWYRYHALFREFLLGELLRVEPDAIMKLHLRAADWYEANGSPAIALEHLLSTTERDRCVELTTELVLQTYQAGQVSTVQRWLSELGAAAITGHPPLAVLAGWIAVLTGQTTEAQRWASVVEAASFDLVPLDGTSSFDSARAMLRAVMCPAGPEQMLADASFAVAQELPWSPWRDTALCLCAEAHLLAGDVERAAVLFAESATSAEAMSNPDSFVLSQSQLALLAMDRGRWVAAAEHVDGALDAIDKHRMHDYATCVLTFAAAARLAVHRGDRTEADRQLTQAMRARPSCTFVLPLLAVRVRLQLAKVYLSVGVATTTRHLLKEIDDVLLHRPALGALGAEVDEFRKALTASAVGVIGGTPLSPAELRLLPYLQTHLTIREIGERLYLSRNTVSTEIGSIYRKFGVSSRSDAVRHATAIGLLGG